MDDQVALLSALPWPLLHGRTGTARGQGLRRVDHRLANRVRACPCGETLMWADRLEVERLAMFACRRCCGVASSTAWVCWSQSPKSRRWVRAISLRRLSDEDFEAVVHPWGRTVCCELR